ncbi:MAG TPA: hypothetical protein VMR88_07650 [Candidatus Polarisedimenticolaceae bacterium]|nr:hypothetical protein [Candidatus Polarisedimenticolaceae bacterium]
MQRIIVGVVTYAEDWGYRFVYSTKIRGTPVWEGLNKRDSTNIDNG